MYSLITWLRSHPILNLIIVGIYYLLVTLPHEAVGVAVSGIFKGMPRSRYDFIILCLASGVFIFYIVPLLRNIFRNAERNLLILYLVLTVALTVISINTLLIINIELIHFIQYAAMAILFFPLTYRYADTLFWVTLLSSIDEAYQYWFISPERTNYYDFNDVIINMLGVLFGLLTIRSYPKIHALMMDRKRRFLRNPIILTTIGIAILTTILLLTDTMSVYPNMDGIQSPILLVKKMVTSFWSVVHPNITFHIVQPIEGLVILAFLFIIYTPLWKHSENQNSFTN